MKRNEMLRRMREHEAPWDMVIIGGGATGVGTAVDAAARGYSVLLLEQDDFGKGTSSRSTKLVHGGVRYLEQGNISLVMEALRERGILRRNAPHLVEDRAFVVPRYDWWEGPFYGMGLKLYDLLAGRYGFGRSRILSRNRTLDEIPTLTQKGLRGGIVYYDGQFDDARLLLNLVRTANDQGAVLLNYVRVTGFLKDADGSITGVVARNRESGESIEIKARAVINATGPFSDHTRRMDNPSSEAMIQPSQGVHLVLDSSFLPTQSAMMVPRTPDGRVLFAIPWHGAVIVGTTDTPVKEATLEPRPLAEEIDFLLDTAGSYLQRPPKRNDVLSVFAGVRPLVQAEHGNGKNGNGNANGTQNQGSSVKRQTSSVSRDHSLRGAASGLITIAGGKWTTYRKMGEDTVDFVAAQAGLPIRPCPTKTLNIHGFHANPSVFGELAHYGSDARGILELIKKDPRLKKRLHPTLPHIQAEVVWSARQEMARTVEDVLSRRTRSLLLNARAAIESAPLVARILSRELGQDGTWEKKQVQDFLETARGYCL